MDWHVVPQMPALGPAGMQQHPAYGRACSALGGEVLHLVAGSPRRPCAAVQVLVRRWRGFGRFALIARGPVWAPPPDPDAAATAMRRLVAGLRDRLRGVVATPETLHGLDPLHAQGLLPMTTPGTLAALALDGGPEGWQARMHGKWRNRLRHARSAGLRVRTEPLPPDGTHWLIAREAAQARQRGYQRLPSHFAGAWRQANGARSAIVFAADLPQARNVAGMLFLRHGAVASYHAGWTAEAGRAASAHNLLLWHAMAHFADDGLVRLDLGTLDTERSAGLARFKLGAGATPVRLGTTWLDAPCSRLVARCVVPPRAPDPVAAAAATTAE